MSSLRVTAWKWLRNGDEAFSAMFESIDAARHSIRLEIYIYSDDDMVRRFRDALLRDHQRGVRVKTLVDGIGSYNLPESFWASLREAGGESRVFDRVALKRFGIRNHRKLMVCDDQ